MSEENNEADEAADSCCASCGIAEIDDIKLVPCDGCDLVRYCGDGCRENHKSEHEEDCKKRVAELRDELLFKQPESTHLGDCPICSLPIPIDVDKSAVYACCSKVICEGCRHANLMREVGQRITIKCPFCREPSLKTDEEITKLMMKRIEANDPVAMDQWGGKQYEKGDYRSAFEYWTKAAELGDVEAHYKLSLLYRDGDGVAKDEGKEMHHAQEAAIGGHPDARYSIGAYEWNNNRNSDRAVKHWIISATQGDDLSIKMLMEFFRNGCVSKAQLDATLRAHHAAINATKSPQRKAAEKFEKNSC